MLTREMAVDVPDPLIRLPPLQYEVSDNSVPATLVHKFLEVLEGTPLRARAARLEETFEPDCVWLTRLVLDVAVFDTPETVTQWRATASGGAPLRGADAGDARAILAAYLSLAGVESGWVREQLTDSRGVNRSRMTRRSSREQPG